MEVLQDPGTEGSMFPLHSQDMQGTAGGLPW